MLRGNLFLAVAAPAAVLALLAQPLVASAVAVVVAPGGEAMAAAPAAAPAAAVKGDRLVPGARAPLAKATPRTIEVIGVDAARIVVRDASGAALFEADARAGTTVAARDADIPAFVLRSGATAAVPAPPASDPAAKPAAPAIPETEAAPRRPMRVGCEGAVSSLAGPEARRLLPSRCLAEVPSTAPLALASL